MTGHSQPSAPAIRLTVPADLAHTPLIRACLRDAVWFPTDDDGSRFLLALTEVSVNAIEASQQQCAHPHDVVVTVMGSPAEHVEVSDTAGCWCSPTPKPDHLGAGLTIADALVSLQVYAVAGGTTVRLRLPGPRLEATIPHDRGSA